MKTALSRLIAPTKTSDCRTPTVAEELCMTAVEAKPIKTDASFDEKRRNSEDKKPFSSSALEASLIVSSPTNSRPSAQKKTAVLLMLFFFAASAQNAPKRIRKGAAAEKLSTVSTLVKVVPMFEPMITPTHCERLSTPQSASETAVTVTAAED